MKQFQKLSDKKSFKYSAAESRKSFIAPLFIKAKINSIQTLLS